MYLFYLWGGGHSEHLRESEEGVRCPRTTVIAGCESPSGSSASVLDSWPISPNDPPTPRKGFEILASRAGESSATEGTRCSCEALEFFPSTHPRRLTLPVPPADPTPLQATQGFMVRPCFKISHKENRCLWTGKMLSEQITCCMRVKTRV